MHIPDAVLSPGVAVATSALGAAGFGLALRKLERGLGDRTTVLMGVMAAFVFAAQMINFPVFPGISGHLLGGVLTAVVLGPWAGAGVIGAVLIVQCLLFGDGGLTALGANFVNMGLIGAVAGYGIYAPIRRGIGGRAGILIGAMAAAWFSVILASGAFAVELAASGRRAEFLRILGWMATVHAAIGLGEALITGMVLRFVLLVRPDLIHDDDHESVSPVRGWSQIAFAGLGIALVVAVFLSPLASDAPDGLEWVGTKLGFLNEEATPLIAAPVPEYEMPGLRRLGGLATAAAGAIGTIVVFSVGFALARIFTLKSRPGSNDPLLPGEPAYTAAKSAS